MAAHKLQRGDHVFCWRAAGLYSHHGIYVGDEQFIHFTRQQGEETGINPLLDLVASNSSSQSQGDKMSPCFFCSRCGTSALSKGVIKSCTECFLSGGKPIVFAYGVTRASFLISYRGGCCTMAASSPPNIVLQRAEALLATGFGPYHLLDRNCEDFAVYCKTGLLVTDKQKLGCSGQSTAFVGLSLAAALSSPLLLVAAPIGMVVAMGGFYCLSRIAMDVGVRKDAQSTPFEQELGDMQKGDVVDYPNLL